MTWKREYSCNIISSSARIDKHSYCLDADPELTGSKRKNTELDHNQSRALSSLGQCAAVPAMLPGCGG